MNGLPFSYLFLIYFISKFQGASSDLSFIQYKNLARLRQIKKQHENVPIMWPLTHISSGLNSECGTITLMVSDSALM